MNIVLAEKFIEKKLDEATEQYLNTIPGLREKIEAWEKETGKVFTVSAESFNFF